MELEALRKELAGTRVDPGDDDNGRVSPKRNIVFGKKNNKSLQMNGIENKKVLATTSSTAMDSTLMKEMRKVAGETEQLRQRFELLRSTTIDVFTQLPQESRLWGEQIEGLLSVSQEEVTRLRAKLATESASRRKLQHEVQDLRGCVRVYCRPRPSHDAKNILSLVSHESIVIDRETIRSELGLNGYVSFEFDRVFDFGASQEEIFTEVEQVCSGALDGYSICCMSYGKSGSGKTHTILGDITVQEDNVEIVNHGVQLRTMKQLFSIASHRKDRFNDVFTFTMVEVYNDRLCDLLVGTEAGATRGDLVLVDKPRKVTRSVDGDESASTRMTKLEIRTDIHGDTVVQGLVSVVVNSFEDLISIWTDALTVRAQRILEQGIDIGEYEVASHVVATVQVTSTSIATGHGTSGKLQFFDLAGANLIPRQNVPYKSTDDSVLASAPIHADWRFANRSLETLSEVVEARAQYSRSVPYRNSTITHLLRDSLEADTKVILFACISGDPEDLKETVATLHLASRMRQVNVGKATRHTISPP